MLVATDYLTLFVEDVVIINKSAFDKENLFLIK